MSEVEFTRLIAGPCMRQMGALLRDCVPWSMPSLLESSVSERVAREMLPIVAGMADVEPVWFGQLAAWLGVEARVEAVHEELRLRAVCLQTRRLWRAEAKMSGRRPIWVLPPRRGVEPVEGSGSAGSAGGPVVDPACRVDASVGAVAAGAGEARV